MSIYICPECDEILRCVSYESPVVEYGNFFFDEDAPADSPYEGTHECDGSSDGCGNTKYWCPECEAILNLANLRPYTDDDEDEDEDKEEKGLTEEEQEENKTKVIIPDGRFCASISKHLTAASLYIKCPECENIVLLDEDDDRDEDLECTKCGKILNN